MCEVGAARSVLESASELGEFCASDVLQRGPSGEGGATYLRAVPGSLPAEMLSKHPEPDPRDDAIPSLDELLREAAEAEGGSPLQEQELRQQVADMFALIAPFFSKLLQHCDVSAFTPESQESKSAHILNLHSASSFSLLQDKKHSLAP